MDIVGRIDHWGGTTPDHPAYISGGRRLTYGELCRRSDVLAAHLAGSLPGKAPVVVLGHKESELLIAYLGAVRSVRAYVPVDTAVPPQRIERIVTLGGSRWSLVRHVYLPSVATWVLGNLKIAVGFAFTGACVGEFVAATHGPLGIEARELRIGGSSCPRLAP